ncbi:hypothetical protein Golax_015009 [Gossypium laxum]|uniref:Uncharacterized protein n=1 Tax=Gossypium laxum TaxID=34288 RepID=A0A7J8ZWT9_9ROSI|nr:hypothetical protein [Gossypium laxum]
MSKTMARRSGLFLVEFFKYDAKIPTLGIQWYMRIRVRLDLGHGESFWSIRARVDPEKIIFEWDITLRTSTREGDFQRDMGHHFNKRFTANSSGISRIINTGIKVRIRPSGLRDTINRLMELGSDDESSPIHTDDRKK